MRSTILALTTAALLSSGSAAFKHTSPLLIWSSEPNEQLVDTADAVSSGLIDADEVYGTVHSLGCDWDTLMVVHVDQLHNSHLASRSLPYDSKADLAIPYLLRPTRDSLDSALDKWAKLCGAEIVGQDEATGDKQIVVIDAAKDDDLSSISVPSSRHLLMLTGTHPPVEKRQERPFPKHSSTSASSTSTASSSSTATPSSGKHNSTIPTGGPLLARVQILTTPIITGVLITFLIFLPIIGFGIWALAGIQVPPRMMEISKGMVVGKEKKDQ